jgi:hypothetical protein
MTRTVYILPVPAAPLSNVSRVELSSAAGMICYARAGYSYDILQGEKIDPIPAWRKASPPLCDRRVIARSLDLMCSILLRLPDCHLPDHPIIRLKKSEHLKTVQHDIPTIRETGEQIRVGPDSGFRLGSSRDNLAWTFSYSPAMPVIMYGTLIK